MAITVPHRVLSVDEAATRLTTPAADLDIGVLRDLPLLVVEDAHLLPPEAAASLARLPVVSIGLATPGSAPAFDLLVEDAVDAAGIADGISGTPRAATVRAWTRRSGCCWSPLPTARCSQAPSSPIGWRVAGVGSGRPRPNLQCWWKPTTTL